VRPSVPNHLPAIRRFRPLHGRIKLLNRAWHTSDRTERIGTCASCQEDIDGRERAVHLHGEVYHSGCAL
jgi:hypothetical protein